MHEVGLIDSLKDRWMSPQPELWDHPLTESIGFSHIYMLFVILLLGAMGAAIVCVFENIIFSCQRKRKRKKKCVKMRLDWTQHIQPPRGIVWTKQRRYY